MTAQTVKLVIDCYERGIDYRETQEKVLALNADLGWFQAPANLGFAVIGLLYGEGDFLKSLLYAINCGDDTDCTGATVGATLGIIGGTAAIPEELKAHVGDRIVTVSLNGMYSHRIPKTCSALTDRVCALVPSVFRANRVSFAFTDAATDYPANDVAYWNRLTAAELLSRPPYSYDVTVYRPLTVRVAYDDTPRVGAGDTRRVTLTFFCNPELYESRKLQIRLLLPDGWSVGRYDRTVSLPYPQYAHAIYGCAETEFTLTVGDNVDVVMRAYAEITSPTLPYPMMIPMIFIG